jgi:hypothetical protein
MSDETRRIVRLAVLALISGLQTGAAALISGYTAGTVSQITWIIAALSTLGGVCISVQGSLSMPPGQQTVPMTVEKKIVNP